MMRPQGWSSPIGSQKDSQWAMKQRLQLLLHLAIRDASTLLRCLDGCSGDINETLVIGTGHGAHDHDGVNRLKLVQ
jgi:hypothetical protein